MVPTYQRWIFTKAREYNLQGTLQPGQILVDPFDPASSLMPGGPLPVPADTLQEVSFQSGVTIDSKDDLHGLFGAWANLFGVPPKIKIGVQADSSAETFWHFDKLTGNIISPSLAYLQDSLNHGDVPAYTKRFHFQKRLYMVTGVRTVHGARMKTKSSRFGGIGADVSGGGGGTGAKGQVTSSSESAESFEASSDFVYAYRLNEVNYWGQSTHKPFVKGEVQAEARPQTSVERSENDLVGEGVELRAGVLESDFEGEGWDGVQTAKLQSAINPELVYECVFQID